MPKLKKQILNREISWLSFNGRVLQEAEDTSVPLIERLKFLGIFSSNLDEFFSIRVAALKKLMKHKESQQELEFKPKDVLNLILDTVLKQQYKFNSIYDNILKELERENVFIIDEKQITPELAVHVRSYFQQKVLPTLVPIVIDETKEFPYLKDRAIYLAIRMQKASGKKPKHALIQLPYSKIPRFYEIPASNGKRFIILIDDIIRYCLDDILYSFEYDNIEAWTIKLTRDAELQIDNDFSGTLIEKVSHSLKKRKKGIPARFIYDRSMPPEMLRMFVKRIHLNKDDLIPGARYHNFRDFVKFPTVGKPELTYPPYKQIEHCELNLNESIIKHIAKKDFILHLPYQQYDYVIHFIREAAIDPKVKSIKITLYRVAEHSNIVNALINACLNGKEVTVVLELTARFDEEQNIYWARKLEEVGAKVIYGIDGMKIHAKMCLVTRTEKNKDVQYANLGTGNYNEVTAKMYCDHSFFTIDKRITTEVAAIFDFIEGKQKEIILKNLIVSPFKARESYIKLIDNEIRNVNRKKEAWITIKLNHIVDKPLIEKLYEASKAGVKVNVIARTTCTMMPINDNIKIISIVDRFLEHVRLYAFCNGGAPKYYLSSSDWMTRNLDHRIEVGFPIFDKKIQAEIQTIINFQLNDNVKSRIINKTLDNKYNKSVGEIPIHAQEEIYNMLNSCHTPPSKIIEEKKVVLRKVSA